MRSLARGGEPSAEEVAMRDSQVVPDDRPRLILICCARRSGVGDRAVFYYLDQLSSLGYVDKHFPLTADRPKARDVRYRLLDPLLRFWFHFVYPHTSRIAQAGPARALSQVVQPGLDAYFGRCFETLCREALPVLYEKEESPPISRSGRAGTEAFRS